MFNNTVFVPLSDFADITGDVEVRAGTLSFYGNGVVETRDYPEGITDCKFILKSGGPYGTSVVKIEGTVDGQTWETVGPAKEVSSLDTEGSEVLLENYVKGKKYRKMRFSLNYGGRTATINYLTMSYNDGYVWDMLASGATPDDGTTMTIARLLPVNSSQARLMPLR